MNYLTHQLLNSEELEILRKNLNQEELLWEDGKQTAGKLAAKVKNNLQLRSCLLYTSPSPRDRTRSRMPSSA